ncbi:MAG: TAXI family TRAP transporter solute-binding subunit [Campylobacterales bacterium]|nr:TAXI family TRAP transporter solute-binding subunit [Campylobacterales bacterium]
MAFLLSRFFTLFALLFSLFSSSLFAQEPSRNFVFKGGPEGGTVHHLANGLSTVLTQNMREVSFFYEPSKGDSVGSKANIKHISLKEADFGIAYSGDLYLAIQNDKEIPAKNVHALAYLFGSPVHLVVRADSSIKSVFDLAGKKVGVGPTGGGPSIVAERFFKSIGLWEKITPVGCNYKRMAQVMASGELDAVWVFAGHPHPSVMETAKAIPIRILPLDEAATQGDLAYEHPYYIPVTIPANTYPGVSYEVNTFQDSALWVAGAHVEEAVVYEALRQVFAPTNLAFLHSLTPAAKSVSDTAPLTGIITTIHKGAGRYWGEKGLDTNFANGHFTGSF